MLIFPVMRYLKSLFYHMAMTLSLQLTYLTHYPKAEKGELTRPQDMTKGHTLGRRSVVTIRRR
jgi:hypothetical protein